MSSAETGPNPSFPILKSKLPQSWALLLGKKTRTGQWLAAPPMTYARVSTDDTSGIIRAYTGEGELTNDPLDTFGHRAVVYTPNLQKLLAYLCKNGFEHHVAMTMSHVAPVLTEAFSTYMKWDVYHHQEQAY